MLSEWKECGARTHNNYSGLAQNDQGSKGDFCSPLKVVARPGSVGLLAGGGGGGSLPPFAFTAELDRCAED